MGLIFYNIAPCNLCYEDLDARFADEYVGNGPENRPFCGNNLCESRVPTPAPQTGENCLNDGFNPQGDGTADIYYAGGNEGTEIWTAWIRPLVTGQQFNGPVLDEANQFSELVQMRNMLNKMNDYLRANGNLDFKKGEVFANTDCYSENNCGGDPARGETKTFKKAGWLFKSATVYEGVDMSAAGQPSFARWLAKDREKYFIIYNRSFAGPELLYHPRQVGGADAYVFSNQMRDQAARSLVTELPVCAAANFWLNPRDNISIAGLVRSPVSQAIMTAAATENSWSNHLASYFSDIEAGNNDVYGDLQPVESFINVPVYPEQSDPRYAGKNNFYWVWRNSFLGKAWALQEKLFHTQGYEYNYAPKRVFMTHFFFGNPFVWWWQEPLPFATPGPSSTPTPTPTSIPSPTPVSSCIPPSGAIRMQGPEEGSKINYGDPTLMVKDLAPLNSCYPHDVVLSVWQGNNKIYSSGFLEDVARQPEYATTTVVNPLLAPGNYQWRVNLRNTVNQTTPFDLIPKFNFAVCGRLAKPELVELYYGSVRYNGQAAFTIYQGDRIKLTVRDVSDPNTTCYPHNVIYNIWPERGSMYLRSTGWQMEKINQAGDTYQGIMETNDLPQGKYELRANLSNSSIDQDGGQHQWGSRSVAPLIFRFDIIEWYSECGYTTGSARCRRIKGVGQKKCVDDSWCETCDPVNCTGYCALGKSCAPDPRYGGECRCIE